MLSKPFWRVVAIRALARRCPPLTPSTAPKRTLNFLFYTCQIPSPPLKRLSSYVPKRCRNQEAGTVASLARWGRARVCDLVQIAGGAGLLQRQRPPARLVWGRTVCAAVIVASSASWSHAHMRRVPIARGQAIRSPIKFVSVCHPLSVCAAPLFLVCDVLCPPFHVPLGIVMLLRSSLLHTEAFERHLIQGPV